MRNLLAVAAAVIAAAFLVLTVPVGTAVATVDGHKIVTRANVSIPAVDDLYAISAACGSGYDVLGGGYYLHPDYPSVQITASRPVDGTNPFWEVRLKNPSGSSATLSVYAVCALA